MLLSHLITSDSYQLQEATDKSFISPDETISLEIDLSSWAWSEAIVTLRFHGSAASEAKKHIIRNSQWVKQTVKTALKKFGWEITDTMLRSRPPSGEVPTLRFFFGMEFVEMSGNKEVPRTNNIGTSYFLDKISAPIYISGPDKKRLMAMKIGDIESFTGVSYDEITVKRVV